MSYRNNLSLDDVGKIRAFFAEKRVTYAKEMLVGGGKNKGKFRELAATLNGTYVVLLNEKPVTAGDCYERHGDMLCVPLDGYFVSIEMAITAYNSLV